MTSQSLDFDAEWLEADGLGGFASGAVSGIRTRRYHALLLAATRPPAGRMVLVNGFDAWVETPDGTVEISSQRYAPDVIHPRGCDRIAGFEPEPWPHWSYDLGGGCLLEQEIFVPYERAAVALRWRLRGGAAGPVKLFVRPFLSGRDFHSTHHENAGFNFAASITGEVVAWHAYLNVSDVLARSNGRYENRPEWYRQFAYAEEQARGLDFLEDLASPGVFIFDLAEGDAELTFATQEHKSLFARTVSELAADERARRAAFATPLHRAADAYFVRRGAGRTLIAAIRGSATGGATRSSRCGASAWPRGGSRTRAAFSRNGPASSPRACFRISSPMAAARRNTTPSMPRCGM